MSKIACLILCASVVIFSCTPKTTEVVKAPEIVEEVVKPTEPENPCKTLSKLSGYEREQVETAYVLYKDLVKLKKYKKAYPLWKKAYYGAPSANGSIKYQFEDGIKIYKAFYDAAKDDALKSSYVDTIMMIYDKRVECFGEADYVAGRKAFDYYYYYNSYASEDEIYDLFKQAIDAKGEKTDYFVVNPFTKILSDKIIREELDLSEGRDYAKKLNAVIYYGNASGKNKEAWEIINAYAPARLENLEGIEGLYDCEYYSEKYLAEYNDNPEDCEVINKVYGRLLWGNCDRNSEAVNTLRQAKQTNCYTPPPPPGPLTQAFNAYTEGRYKEAVQLFDNFVQTTNDTDKKFKYTMMISKIYYGDIKNFVQSRKFANQAAEINSESGEPHLLIGKLYASSGPLCGPGTGWDSQIVTWPAIDEWQKAKSDPNTKGEATKLINTYIQYMPKKEDIFLRGIKAGSSYKVGCWINRNTKVRTAD